MIMLIFLLFSFNLSLDEYLYINITFLLVNLKEDLIFLALNTNLYKIIYEYVHSFLESKIYLNRYW